MRRERVGLRAVDGTQRINGEAEKMGGKRGKTKEEEGKRGA